MSGGYVYNKRGPWVKKRDREIGHLRARSRSQAAVGLWRRASHDKSVVQTNHCVGIDPGCRVSALGVADGTGTFQDHAGKKHHASCSRDKWGLTCPSPLTTTSGRCQQTASSTRQKLEEVRNHPQAINHAVPPVFPCLRQWH